MGEDNTKLIRLKLYMAPLLPVDKDAIKDLDLSKINIDKNQIYVYKDDIHRELFSQILLDIGKAKGRKPSYKKVTLNDLIEHHFDPEHPSTSIYVVPDVLFVTYTTATLENKIYGPVLDKVVEERKAFGKKTYVFHKGDTSKIRTLKTSSLDDIIDFNSVGVTRKRKEI